MRVSQAIYRHLTMAICTHMFAHSQYPFALACTKSVQVIQFNYTIAIT